MTPRSSRRILSRASLMVAAALLGSVPAGQAAILTWDGADLVTTGAQGGAGTWNTNTTANWWNGTADIVWPALGGTDDDAVFAGTAGAVTIGAGGVTANDLTFNTTLYTLSGATLTLNGTTPTITTAASVNATLSAVVAGSAGLTKAGAGTLLLNGANTYTGTTILSAGTLSIAADSGLGTAPASATPGSIVFNGGTLNLTLVFQTNVNRGVLINAGGGTLNGGSGNFGFAGLVAGTGALTITGAGTYITGSSLHTYSGGTILSSGTTTVFQSTSDGKGVLLTRGPFGTGTLSLRGGLLRASTAAGTYLIGNRISFEADTTVPDAGTGRLPFELAGDATLTGSRTLTQNSQAAVNISGAIGESAALSGLTKAGTGTLTLSGANTYTGVTSINAGVLNVASLTNYGVAGPLGQRASSSEASANIGLRFAAGTLQYTGATAQSTDRQIRIHTGGGTIDASGSVVGATVTFAYGGANTDLFDTAGTRTLTLTGTNTGANTFTIGLQDQATNKTALTKSGAGTWVLAGTQTYTGVTTVSAGTLRIARTSALYNATAASWTAANIKVTAGTLALNVGGTGEFSSTEVTTLLTSLGGANGGTAGGFGAGSAIGFDTTNASGGAFTVGDLIANPTGAGAGTLGVTKSGTGTLTLSGANTYTGLTTVSAGTLQAGVSGVFTSKGGLNLSGTGVFDLAGFNAGFTSLASASTNLITNNSTSTAASNATAVGTPSGTGIYVDALTLSSAGQTIAAQITDGTVRETQVVINNSLGSAERAGLNNTTNTFSGGLVLAFVGGTGTRLRLNAAFTGTPFGTGPIIIGQAATDKAQILIDAPTAVTLANDIFVNTALGSDVVGTLRIDTAGHVLSGRITANLAPVQIYSTSGTASITLSGQVVGPQGLTVESTAATFTTTLSASNSYAGPTTITGGTLRVSSDGNLGAVPGTASAGNIAINGGTLASTGTFTISSNRGIALGSATASTGGTIDVASAQTLTYGGIIANNGGTNSLTKTGAGTLTLTGANTFTGGVTIGGGTLVLTRVDALPVPSTITISSGAGAGTLRLATDTSVNAWNIGASSSNPGTIVSDRATAGTGITHVLGTAQLGNNTYGFQSGTNVTGGTAGISFASMDLAAGNAGTALLNPTTASLTIVGGVSIASNNFAKTLGLGGTSAGNAVQGVIANGINTLAVTKSGTGTWTLSGANTYTGVTTINEGVLSVATIGNGGAAGNLGQATNAAGNLVLGGGTLQYTGATASTDRAFTLTAGTTSTVNVTTAATVLTLSGASATTTGALTKTGPGTLTLSGANTYSGGTNINGGTVTSTREAVSGGAAALGSSVPANLVTIGNGGILTGNINNWLESTNLAAGGTNARTVQVNAGGILRGAANSVITGLGNVTLNGGTLEITNGFASGSWNGSFTLGGDVTVTGTTASAITTATGAGASASLQMSNGANGVGGTRTFRVNDVTSSAASDLVVSANLANGTILKEGAGTLELIAGASGTATPVNWTVNAGTLSLAASGGTGRVRGVLTVNAGATVVTTGDGTGLGYNTAKPTQIVINGGTVTSAVTTHIWDLSGGVQMTGGTLQSNQGTSTTTGSQLEWRNTAVTTLASAATATIAGRLNLRADGGNGISFNVADGAAATDLLISAAITQSGTGTGQSLTKSGNGTLTLSGVNSYAGATTVTAGTLVYQNTYASAAHAIDTGAVLELNVATGTRGAATTTFSGAGTLRKTGAGEVVWNAGTGTFALGSGALIDVQAGTFFGGSGANEVWTNNRSDLNIASGATFSTVEANVRVNGLTGSGTLRTGFAGSGYQNLTIGVDNGTSAFAGVIADASAEGHVVKQGSGVITLSGANTFTGTTTIGAGTLKLTNNLALQSSAFNTAGAGTLDLTDAAIGALTLGGLVGDAVTGQSLALPANVTSLTLNPASGRSRSYLRDLTGGAAGLSLTKSGGGTQTLGGVNVYRGVTTLSAGVLNVTALTNYDVAGPLGQRAASSEAFGDIGLRFTGGTLQYTGATAQSTDRQIRLGTSGGTIDASGSVPGATVAFTYNGANTDLFDGVGPRTLTLTGTNTGANTFALGLTDQNASTGKTGLTKSGNGTWILTGTHTYTGATSITGGTLTLATSIAGSATTINGATAALTGVGTAGAVTLTAGALRPGDGSATGVLNVGALSIAAGQSLGFVLGAPGTSSRVAAASLALPATGAPLKVSLTDNADAGGNGRLADGTYSLVSYSDTLTAGNPAFGRTLNVVTSPLTNRAYAFANTGTANGAVTVTIARQSPVILQDSFARTGPLGGTAPVVAASSATGATWTSAAGITTNEGARSVSFNPLSQDSAALGFLPQAGNVYTLSANMSPSGAADTNWRALGFANSAPPTTSINNNATLAWMLQRNSESGQSFFGGGTGNGVAHSAAVGGSEQTNTIVLDTRNGLANATLHFLVNGVAQRAAVTGFDATAIANVVIGNYLTGGAVKDLSLTAGSTWLPVVGSNSWDNAANWSAGYRPGAAETIAVFAPFLGVVGQTITLDADQTVGQLAFANSVAGGGGFTVAQGVAGTLTFDNNAAGASLSNGFGDNRIAAPVVLNDALTVDVATGSLEMSASVGQTGGARGLTKNGNGLLILSGANTYAGPTTVNAGTLRLAGTASAHAASALVMNAGTILDVRASLTVDSLTFNGATTANIAATGTSASLLATTTLTTGSTDAVTLNVTGATPGSWASGTYPLFAYGSLTGAGFLLGDVAGTTSRMLSRTLIDTGSQISLVVVNDTPKWTGVVSNELDDTYGDWWNDGGNWRLLASAETTDFLNGDAVVFDDTATGVTHVNVDFQATPSAVVFDNTTKDYVLDSLSGVGIGGTGSLTKRGSGRLEIRNPNTYSGPTLIEGGTLALVGTAGYVGATSAVTLAGGSLDLGGSDRTLGSLSVTGAAPGGVDTLVNGGVFAGSYAVSNPTGNAVIAARLLETGAAGLTKTGAGTATLTGANTYRGPTLVSEGALMISGAGTLGSGSALSFLGGRIDLGGTTQTVGAVTFTVPASTGTTLSNGSLSGTSYAAGNTTGSLVISAHLLTNANAGFAKTGAGALTLSGNNTFTGALTIAANSGLVTLSGDNSGRPAGAQGLTVVNNGATLRLHAHEGNTAAGVSTALSSERTAAQPLLLNNGSTLQLRADSAVSFAGANSLGGVGGATITIDVGRLTSSGSGNTLTLAPGGFVVWNTTLNVTGADGYVLRLPAITSSGIGSATYNPTTANLSLGTYTADAAVTLGLAGTSTGNVVTGAITNGTGTLAVTKSNSGVWTLSGANTYTGATTVSAGTLKVGAADAFTNKGALALSGTGVFDLNGFDAVFAGNVPAGVATNLITDNAGGSGTSVLTFRQTTNTGVTTAAQITDGPSRKVAVAFANNNGAQQFTNAFNTFSGGLTLLHSTDGTRVHVASVPVNTIVSGVLTASPYGTGPITIGQVATDKAGIFVSAASTTIANAVVFNTGLGTDRAGIRYDSTGNTLSGTITANNAAATFSTNSTGAVTLAGRVTGANGLTLDNAFGTTITVTLNNATGVANDYQGETRIAGTKGILVLGAAEQIPNGASAANLNASGTFRLQGFNETINGLTGNGNVTTTVAGASVLTLGDNDATASFSGTITESVGTIGLVKIGDGTQTLSGANTFTGGAWVKAGALRLSAGNDRLATTSTVTLGDASSAGKLIVGETDVARTQTLAGLVTSGLGGGVVGSAATNSTLTLNIASGSNTFNGQIGGAGANENNLALTKTGAGILVLGGANSHVGNTLFGTAAGTSTGILRLTNSGALGSGKLIINNGNNDTGTVELAGGITLSNNVDFFGRAGSGTAAIIRNVSGDNVLSGVLAGSFNGVNYNFHSDAGTLTISNRITTNSGGRMLNLRGAGTIRISGVIENGTGGMNVRAMDGGTYVLSGANTYTGTTTVNGGTLRVTSLGTTGASSVGASDRETAANLLLNGPVRLEYAGAGEATSRSFTIAGTGLTLASTGAGAVEFTSASQVAFAADGASTRELRLAGSNTGDNTFGSTLSGTPLEADTIKQITKNDVGTWVLSGPANRFHGDVRVDVNGGTLGLTSGALNTSGAGLISINAHSTLRWETGNTDDLSGRLFIADGAQAGVSVTTGVVTFASGLQLGANKSGTLLKTGNGTLKLATSQEMAGITVAAGLLDIAAGANVGTVTVNNGGTLSGKGSTGAVAVASGGTLSPGSSPGTLTHSSLSLAGGSTVNWEVYDATGAAGFGYDRLVVTGVLDLTGANPNSRIMLRIRSLATQDTAGNPLNFGPPNGVSSIRTFQFGQAGGLLLNAGQNISDVFAFDVTDFRYSDGSTSHASLWSINRDAGAITLTAVPEPSTYGLGLGALALAAAALRRRRRPAPQA